MSETPLQVKFHTDLLHQVIATRTKNDFYQTNKLIKTVGAYYVLKSLTTSGIIQDYHKNIDKLCSYLNCSVPTFYKLIRNCERSNYLKRSQGNLILASYSGFVETFDCILTRFTTVKYNYQEQKYTHTLEAAFLQLKERERSKTFESKFKANKDLVQDLSTVINPDKNGNYQTALEAMQKWAFNKGHDKMYSIFYLNPFPSVNSKTMCAMFGFKSEQSIAYLKTKLTKSKLITVKKEQIPNTIHIPVKLRPKHLFTSWNAKNKQVNWVLPDRLNYAPILEI